SRGKKLFCSVLDNSKLVDLAFNDLYLIRGKKIELCCGAENGLPVEKKRVKCSRVAVTLCFSKCFPCIYPDEVYLIDPPVAAAACVYAEHKPGLEFATLTVVSSNFTSNWWLRPLALRSRGLKEQQPNQQQGELIYTVHCSSVRPKTTDSEASHSTPSKFTAAPRLARRFSGHRRKGWGLVKMLPKKSVSLTDGTDGVVSGAATCPMPGRSSPRLSTSCSPVDPALLAKAKATAQEAINKNMVFAVLGPYRHIREGMRRRGWVEKYYQAPTTVSSERVTSPRCPRASKSQSSNDSSYRDLEVFKGDIDYNDEQQNDLGYATNGRRLLPWEEKNGFYGLLGRYVRHVVPNFIWSLKKAQIDFRFLRPGQIVNHHTRAPFTTKVGLCRNLRLRGSSKEKMVDSLFPRCFVISQDEDRAQFIKEFRLTACMSALKWACNYYDLPNHPTDNVLG
uniref:Tubulin monoglycylase TTLL3-like n=2 Tax=Mesocestoides corti TaxID=53468 RepID=A0A5K3FHY9_MESCO